MKNQVHTNKKEMNKNQNHLDGAIVAEYSKNPQKAFEMEKNLYRSDLFEMLKPIEEEIQRLGTFFGSQEHDALRLVIYLLKSGNGVAVERALEPITDLVSKLKEKDELIDEVSGIVQSNFTVSILEDGTQEPMSICDSAIMQVELIGSLLIDHEETTNN